jgi:hypothetical protein
VTRFLLTLKQLRFETRAAVVLSVGSSLAAIFEAWRVQTLNTPASCLPLSAGSTSAACTPAVRSWNDLMGSPDMTLAWLMLTMAPFAVGILLGAPIVARELETGTASLAWTMNSSRARWLAVRTLSVLAVMVPLLLLIGISANILTAAKNPTVDVNAAFVDYASRGIFPLAWGLAAFAGAAWLGAVAGRVMPAVLTVAVASILLQGLWPSVWSRALLTPLAIPANLHGGEVDFQTDRWSYARYFMDGKPFSGDPDAWWAAYTPPLDGPAVPTADPNVVTPNPDQEVGPVPVDYVIRGKDWYWPVTVLEAGTLTIIGLLLAGATLYVVERRRPY